MVRQLRPTLTATVLGQATDPGWRQLNSHFLQCARVRAQRYVLILTLIILVAAFNNIITGITMLVKSKGRDASPSLRGMGATQGAVMRIFFLAGASIGVAGT
ncbi:MAG: hypothetical protein R3C69_01325 [Geminicoccaceae bacterium]